MTSDPRNVLIVDGYNVIAARDAEAGASDLHSARAALVEEVAGYASGRFEAFVVFDAHSNPRADGKPHEIVGVTVVFSRFGTEADAVVERIAHDALAAGRSVHLVTSDAETQRVVARKNVRRIPVREFVADLEEARSERLAGTDRERYRVEDAVDEETRAALMRWAQGR
jgi:predicted RNA-binding protein with PIN domain